MIAPFKLYDLNSKRMIPTRDAFGMGIFLASDGSPVQYKNGAFIRLHAIDVLHCTGWIDTAMKPVYERDVVDVDIEYDFDGVSSLSRERGVVEYDKLDGGFCVSFERKSLNEDPLRIVRMTIIGNVYGTR